MFDTITSEKNREFRDNILDAISALVIVIDEDGEIVKTNQSWDTFCHKHQESGGIHKNYFNLCKALVEKGDDYALKTILGLHSVLNGTREKFTITIPSPIGNKQQWFDLKAIPLNQDKNNLVLIHEDVTDTVMKTRELRESEERYRRQFEHSLEGCMITTTKGECVDANPTASELLMRTKEELLELPREEIVVVDDPGFQDALKQRKKTGSYRSEFRLKRGDGKEITVEAYSKIYRNEDGEIRSIFNFRDITSRKKAEEELMNEKLFTDSVVNSIPGGFVVLNEDRKLVRWNENLANALGYSEKELREISALDLLHPDDYEKGEHLIDTILEYGIAESELRLFNKDGELFYMLFQGQRLQQKGETYIVGSGINITEQKRIEAQNRRQQVMMDQLFENSPIGIAMVNENREIMRINRSFTDIFGYESDEATGSDIDNLLIPGDMKEEAKILSNQGFDGDTFQVDTVRQAKDGSLVPVLIGGVPVEMEGDMIAVYGMYADISERKKLEEQIHELLMKEKKERKQAEKDKLRLEDMFTRAPSAICILEGPNHEYTFANEAYKTMVGQCDVVGHTVQEVIPEIENQELIERLDHVYQTGESYHANEAPILISKNGDDGLEELILNFAYKPLKDSNNEVYGIFVQVIDVTEQVKNRNQLSKSLKEKEVLIKEIHHRVKNNLALISSMIELQMEEAPDQYEAQSLFATKSRVHTIAQIQELIYQNEDLSNIPFDRYLRNVINFLGPKHTAEEGPAEINLNLEPVSLNINQAIPLGLLINEIVAKVEQLSEHQQKPHAVAMELNTAGDRLTFSLTYKGFPMAESLSFRKTKSLNDTLIDTLSRQLNATLQCHNTGDDTVSISLHLVHAKKQGAASMLA